MKIRSIVAAIAIPAAVMLTAAACGEDEPSAPATQVAPGVWEMDQDNLRFIPRNLTVAEGETIRFVNSETALHTVTIDGDNLSGTMNRNDVFEWIVPGAGEYAITCDLHPQMKATITAE